MDPIKTQAATAIPAQTPKKNELSTTDILREAAKNVDAFFKDAPTTLDGLFKLSDWCCGYDGTESFQINHNRFAKFESIMTVTSKNSNAYKDAVEWATIIFALLRYETLREKELQQEAQAQKAP